MAETIRWEVVVGSEGLAVIMRGESLMSRLRPNGFGDVNGARAATQGDAVDRDGHRSRRLALVEFIPATYEKGVIDAGLES